MGSATYIAGEGKVRPGLYKRVIKGDNGNASGAIDGICAVTVKSSWGPEKKVTVHEKATSNTVMETYGNSGTVGVVDMLFEAGAKTVYVYRLDGEGGTKGSLTLQGSTEKGGESVVDCVSLEAKYSGARTLSVTVRDLLGYEDMKEFLVYDGSTQVEKTIFDGKVGSLIAAINEKSAFFVATKAEAATNEHFVADITQSAITEGTDPTVTVDSYNEALSALEPYTFNVICLDTDTASTQIVLHEYVKRTYESGKLAMAVIGEPTSVPFETRISHAAEFNDEKMVYVGGAAYNQNGDKVEGYKAAALVAGLIASTPSSSSIVHKVVPGLTETMEKLTNTQYTNAIRSGMLLFADSGNGQVWMDSGVNTLVVPGDEQDDGWKKIKRVKTRFELIDRIDRTVAPVIGKINCNADGVANVIKLGQDIIDAMVTEGKLFNGGTIYEDPANPFKNDSAWFIIDVDDLDTLEKIYFTYKFRFSVN